MTLEDAVKTTLQEIEADLASAEWHITNVGARNLEEFIGESDSWKFVIIRINLDNKSYSDGSAISKVAGSSFNIVHLTHELVEKGIKLALKKAKK